MKYRYEVVRYFGEETGVTSHWGACISPGLATEMARTMSSILGTTWAVFDREARSWWKLWSPGRIIYLEKDGQVIKAFKD